jgi:hypothetical protein
VQRSAAEFLAESGVVTADVVQPLLELREDRFVQAFVLLDALTRARDCSIVQSDLANPITDTWRWHAVPSLESGENLVVNQVADGSEGDEGVGAWRAR